MLDRLKYRTLLTSSSQPADVYVRVDNKLRRHNAAGLFRNDPHSPHRSSPLSPMISSLTRWSYPAVECMLFLDHSSLGVVRWLALLPFGGLVCFAVAPIADDVSLSRKPTLWTKKCSTPAASHRSLYVPLSPSTCCWASLLHHRRDLLGEAQQ